MSHQLEIAYARVEVAARDEVAAFFDHIVGLARSEPTDAGDLTWTDDAAAQRVILAEGPADDLAELGFEAVDSDAFDLTFERLSDVGFAPVMRDDLASARRVKSIASVDAPWGSAVELVLGLERTAAPATPLMPGGFLTHAQGFGHAVIATTAFDESLHFVTEGLGLAQSDWLETELAPGIALEVHFFHCNARHHSLALARAPFEMPRLHHLMFETNDRDDVGHAFDRAFEAGCTLPNGLGLHDNDRMFSFYVASPAGFQVEIGHGARQVSEPWTDDRRYDRISAWGHQPVAPRA
jgi:2,3-dihydroxybiphenyl 1,2-dioxygenase